MPDRGGFRRATILVLIVAVVLVVVVIGLHFMHLGSQRSDLNQAAAQGPAVQIVAASAGPPEQIVTVLASVRPFLEATLYAKVSGYLKNVLVDKGDMVKAGQLLATIESEETDAQYNSARADLLNKQQIARRYDQLLRESAVAAQQADQADADARIAAATLQQAATLKSYELLLAPFNGKVTTRYVDPGALVQNATTSQTSSQPIVTISDDRSLRIDAYVQQDVAPYVHVGDGAEIVDATNAGRRIEAKITHVSGALDPRTRTMLVEVVMDNPEGFLLGGSFAYMTLHVPMHSQTQIPVDALITRGTDQFVALVGRDSRLHFVKVTVASTDGEKVTLVEGIKPGTKVAVDLPAEAFDGSLVRPVAAQSQ